MIRVQEHILEQEETTKAETELGSIVLFYISCLLVCASCIAGHFDVIESLVQIILIVLVSYPIFVVVVNLLVVRFYDKNRLFSYISVLLWVGIISINSTFTTLVNRRFKQREGFIFLPWRSRGIKATLTILAADYALAGDIIDSKVLDCDVMDGRLLDIISLHE